MFDVNWGEIWGFVITTVVIGLIKFTYSVLKDLKQKNEQEQRTKNNIIQALMKNSEELTDWKQEIDQNTVHFQQEIIALHQQIQKIKTGDLILMRDRILQTCRYYISKGYITLPMRENLTEMYQCYQSMGGNGTGKLMYEQTLQLPVKTDSMCAVEIVHSPEEEIENGTKSPKRKRKSAPKSEVGK